MQCMGRDISERECALLVSCRANDKMVIGSNIANYNFSAMLVFYHYCSMYIGGQGLPAYCRSCKGTWCVVSNGACFLIACVRTHPFQFWGASVCVRFDFRVRP